jgi:hypothetical protein
VKDLLAAGFLKARLKRSEYFWIMIKISRNNQIIFYIIILVFVISFFFYFYRQASVTDSIFSELKPNGAKPAALSSREDANIDIKLFTSEKFRNLRADVVPIQSFETGKRNPFEAY